MTPTQSPTGQPTTEVAPKASVVGDWRPIETAPKDGRVIEITALFDDGEVFEIWPMSWAHIQRNGLFPGVVGMWTSAGEITWNGTPDEGGPTHWRPVSHGSDLGRGRVQQHATHITERAGQDHGR